MNYEEKFDIPVNIQLVRKFQAVIKDQNVEKLMELLSEFSPNVRSTRGGFATPLSFACYYSRGLIVEILLSHGANPDILDSGNQSCLINYLSSRNIILERDLPVISNIISRSPLLVNLPTDRGITPLYQAIAYDTPVEIIQLLINSGADPNQNGPDGSILFTAANNLILTMEDNTGIPQNIYPNSRDILLYLIRSTNIIVPPIPQKFIRYPEIVEIFDMERKRRQMISYNKEFSEKGKKAAVIRRLSKIAPDSIDEVLKYIFDGKRKPKKSRKASRRSSRRSRRASRRSRKASRRSRRSSRKSRRSRRASRKSRKASRRSRRVSRKSRKASRRSRKASRKSRKSRRVSRKLKKSRRSRKTSRKIIR